MTWGELQDLAETLAAPVRLWSASEVTDRRSRVPREAGLYGWHFRTSPGAGAPAGRIAYLGIASTSLRDRLRNHYRRDASRSTLRFTLGCLMGLQLRRVGPGERKRYTDDDERALTDWMAANGRVCWIPLPAPRRVEKSLIAALDLPLNIDHNAHHPGHERLVRLRATATARALALPALP